MMMGPVSPHIPVLLEPLIEAVSPVSGVWLDGTFGAGGYSRALLEAGAERVIGRRRCEHGFRMHLVRTVRPWRQDRPIGRFAR